MQSATYTGLPRVHICFFTAVQNAAALRSRLIAAAGIDGTHGDVEREAVNFAFVDAASIVSHLHLRTAIYQALLAHSRGSLRTKTVHSEILFALNPSNNITEAIKRFGINDKTQALILVRVGNVDETVDGRAAGTLDDNAVFDRMKSLVQGRPINLEEGIEHATDWDMVKKIYKLPQISALRTCIQEVVVSSVAMKSVMS
ncbi:hypothetical protein BS47DRAFT_1338337 [Hydnum rufescens UP504]|uniref:EKC/KEOPS complex subunit CGI121 n=1 Tax=Hydnum rufescens UP504 TaxID=1448309 RepID=A0A9P6DXE9_9AGAM|nr:hypothetical protein BS47DRAFT_1338337 [Hydnum rufescens UP504]